jgi:hypothetical protein
MIVTLALLVGVLPSADARSLASYSPVSSAIRHATGGGCAAASSDAYVTAVLADSPVAYYPLDESSGTTMCDDSGNGNAGSYAGSGVTYGLTGPLAIDSTQTGVSGDGSSASLLGTGPALTALSGGDQSFTLEGWYRAGSTPANEALVSLHDAYPYTDGLAVLKNVNGCGSSGDVELALDELAASNCWDAQALAGINLQDGDWHYLAITYDSSTTDVSGYVDGHDLGSQTLGKYTEYGQTVDWNGPTVLVGGWGAGGSTENPFHDDAAQIAVYGTALSTAQIDAHYGSALAYTVSASLTPGGVVNASDVNPSALCAGASCKLDAGDTVTLTAVPAAGYDFYSWGGIGDPCIDSTVTTCTITNVQASNSSPVAQFLLIQPPTVSDYTTTAVSDTSETLNAKVESHGLSTSYSLVYGTTIGYGKTASGATITSGSKTVSFTLAGLTPGTAYHYKVLASSSGGSSDGGDGSFATGAPPVPIAAPVLTDVTAALAGLTSAQVSGEIKNPPYPGARVSYYVEYVPHADYVRAIHNPTVTDPYNQKTATKTASPPNSLHDIDVKGALATLSGLSPATTYDYRLVATATDTTSVAYSADATITTPPQGPTVTTSAPTSVSSAGATMNGTINDNGTAGRYTFNWSASYPGATGCSGPTATVTGSLTGDISAVKGPQSVSALFDQPLPAGSHVTYTLVFDATVSGFPTEISGGPESFGTGSFSPTGAGTAVVESSTSVILAANVVGFTEQPIANSVDPIYQFGNDSSGGVEFTGPNTTEYGVFQYEIPGAASVSYAGSTVLYGGCGTLTTTTLTGLQPDKTYLYAPDQTYGFGTCPATAPQTEYDLPGATLADVDLVGGVDWCWTDDQSVLIQFLSGGFGDINSGTTQYFPAQPEYPTFIGPFLGSATDGRSPSAYPPIIGQSALFTTAATTAPSNSTVTAAGTVSDGLGCSAGATCHGTEALSYAPAAHTASARSARALILGWTTFSIRPHHHKTIRFKLTHAGKTYLAKHPSVTNAKLVIVERAGHGPKVTITRLLSTRSTKPRREKGLRR